MSDQTDLFDSGESRRRKKEGMGLAAGKRMGELGLARQIAKQIAMNNGGLCDADKVGRVLKHSHGIDSLGPAAGSIFKGGEWAFSGEFVKSARVKNHSRLLRVWRFRGA